MSAKKRHPTRRKTAAKRARRAQDQTPTLRMTMTPRQTEWTCPVCYARGSVEHPVDSATEAIADLVRANHATKQPTCVAS
jgi:hypothetical protein